MFYYVMQILGGQNVVAYKYVSEDARDNRFQKVRGGEVYKHDSNLGVPEQAIDEFKAEM